MVVTADKYELPLMVTDSVRELSKFTGIGINCVYSSITKNLSGKRNGWKFVRVPMEGEDSV